MSTADAQRVSPTITPEDQARAAMYALLSRLFYGPPDQALLVDIAQAKELQSKRGDVSLAYEWKVLTVAASHVNAETVRFEYDTLFMGAGKALVTLYSTAYLAGIEHSGQGADKYLVMLRNALTELGIVRQEGVREPEDHVSALFDVMRFFIVPDDQAPVADLDRQRQFFKSYIAPWFEAFANEIEVCEKANFYRRVGRLLRAFLDVEKEAFEIDG